MDRKISDQIAEKVLNYWYTLTFLEQDSLPQLTSEERKNNREAASLVQKDREKGNKKEKKYLRLLTPYNVKESIINIVSDETKKHGMTRWGNITFYVGKSRRERCIAKIAEVLGKMDNRPEENKEEIAWFSFQTTFNGEYIKDTFSFSTLIWAVAHIKDLQKDKMSDGLNINEYRNDVKYYEETIKDRLEKRGKNNFDGDSKACIEGIVLKEDIDIIYEDICQKYIKIFNEETDNSDDYCVMMYQIFKDGEAQENYADDNYLGLTKDFFSNDLKMILSKIKTKEFKKENRMNVALIQYIVGKYNDYYQEDSDINCGRLNLGQSGKEHDIREFLAEALDVKHAPEGKWPSRFMPVLMQQLAVNLVSDQSLLLKKNSENDSIFSVNGPPGTGKTTLLKEIIVDSVVKRAELLTKYNEPDDAFETCSFSFGEKKKNGYSDFFPQYYKLKEDSINNYSILVTSCNNTAVENITKELPTESGIVGALCSMPNDSDNFKKQLKEVQNLFCVKESQKKEELYSKDVEKKGIYQDIYFSEYARELLNNKDAWGIVSVPLGKKSNIHNFYQKVLCMLDNDFYRNEKMKKRMGNFQLAKQQFIKQKEKVQKKCRELELYCGAESELCRKRKMSKNDICKAEKENEKSQEQLKNLLSQKAVVEESIAKLRENIQILEQEGCCVLEKMQKLEQSYEEMNLVYVENLEKSLDIRNNIGFFENLFHTSNAKLKNELADKYESKAEKEKVLSEQLKMDYEAMNVTYDLKMEEINYINLSIREKNLDKEAISKLINQEENKICENDYKKKYSKEGLQKSEEKYLKLIRKMYDSTDDCNSFSAMDDAFMSKFFSLDENESTTAQVTNFWFTNAYNREREKLFYYALQLHKEFVVSSKCCLRNYRNLALLWQERKDEENEKVFFHPEDRAACFGTLLQSLFLLVPVISTTFASVGSFLSNIKYGGAIGILIIDEAGQASPQTAVGSLYRSRKAIIVGDPRQVEPVVTDELELLKDTFSENVYKPYKSKKISVQQFADLMNPFGTYLENDYNEQEWVGCPLLVHRRCISPMYDIANCISYNNTMKQMTITPDKKKEEGFCYRGSRWINVIGNEVGNKNHYVEKQGKRVLEILELAFSKEENPSLFIITPFTTVKNGMIRCIENEIINNKESVLYKNRITVKEWMYKNIGTVHTFQGKEAQEVIFLLGCDRSKEAAGAILWVNSNIVNVAVTRAKYRIYIVGDEKAWKNSQYISRAKQVIDLYALKELNESINSLTDDNKEKMREKALAFYDKIPTEESLTIEKIVKEDGEVDYLLDPEMFMGELSGGFLLLNELTDEQLEGYGFTRESFESLDIQVKKYLEGGIKLYSMLKKVRKFYDIEDLDASCCGILFCKAIELQIKECFSETLKKIFPNCNVKGAGSGVQLLKSAKKEKMTLGTYQYILRQEQHMRRLADIMSDGKKAKYDYKWWQDFCDSLMQCKNLRNTCCHPSQFSWNQLNQLLKILFLKELNMDGLVRDSEVGRELIEYNN